MITRAVVLTTEVDIWSTFTIIIGIVNSYLFIVSLSLEFSISNRGNDSKYSTKMLALHSIKYGDYIYALRLCIYHCQGFGWKREQTNGNKLTVQREKIIIPFIKRKFPRFAVSNMHSFL